MYYYDFSDVDRHPKNEKLYLGGVSVMWHGQVESKSPVEPPNDLIA